MSNSTGQPTAPAVPDDGRRWDDMRLVAVRLVDEAKTAGAVHAEVLLRRRCRRVTEDRGPIVGPLWDDRISIRCTDKSGRVGKATGAWREASKVIKKAVSSCTGPASSAEGPVDRMDMQDRGLGIDDPRLPRVTDEERRATIDDNRSGVAVIDRSLEVRSLAYYEEREERAFANSGQVSALETSTRFSIRGAVAVAGTKSAVDGMIASRSFAEVSSRPLGVDLARACLALRQAATLPEGPCAVVLGPRAVARILEGLLPAFSSEAIAAERSFLTGRIGRKIGGSALHMIDDASRMGGLGTRAFDDRGTPSVPIPLIKEGVAAGVYQGPLTAAQRETRPSGHSRFDDSLWAGNIIVRGGNRTRNMLFPDLGRFVLVEDVLDVSGIDPVSGQIRIPVTALVHEGTAALGNPGVLTLACTAEELFSSVEAVVSDQQRNGLVDTGTWILDGVGFA